MQIRRNKSLIEQAADAVESAVETAWEKAGPVLVDAKDKAGPVIAAAAADAKDKAGPALADARDKAAPILAAAAAAAADKASAAADLAAEKATIAVEAANDKVAELSGKPKKKHRLRTFLLVTGIAAALGYVASKMRSRRDQENWQTSYTPTPPPRGTAVSETPIADAAAAAADEGGAGPDEALADAAEGERPVTTPDDPASVVEVDGEPAEKG